MDKNVILEEKLNVMSAKLCEIKEIEKNTPQKNDVNRIKCEFVAKNVNDLKVHVKSVHSDPSRIKCWTCNFACASKDDLTIHNDKYWYSHRMRPNQNHKKYMLEEFEKRRIYSQRRYYQHGDRLERLIAILIFVTFFWGEVPR